MGLANNKTLGPGCALAILASFACGSSTAGGSGNDGGTSDGGVGACVASWEAQGAFSSDCVPCFASHCAASASHLQSACAEYYACACPSGTFEVAKITGCVSSLTAACQAADMSASVCKSTNCASQCIPNAGGGSGSGSGSSSGG